MWQQIKKLGRYELRVLLGQGGMGSVYRAYDPQIDREVAIKVINLHALMHSPKEKQEVTLKRFYHEARVMGQFQDPAIVSLYDFGDEGSQPYIVMPLMTGGSLADRLYELKVKNQWLPFAEILRIFELIAPALDRMHAKNIVHRDLKPSNILFDGYNKPYIADFGIAKMTDSSLSFKSGTIGTAGYMSPEQVQRQRLSGKADIYSLGCILHEMLTGEHPYHTAFPPAIPYLHVHEPIPRLDALRTGLPLVWQTIIDRVMAKKPDDRYATVNDLVKAIKDVIEPPLGIGSERICTKDGMVQVYVPAGEFLMGSSDNDPDARDNEKPQHTVYLGAYWIDKTPVTNSMFAKFVTEASYKVEGGWSMPKGKENHPAVNITWNDALAYAFWARRRLPTEAEWEKAAGGTDGRKWSWGNNPPTDKLCNFGMTVGHLTPVGSYPAGASPYGALDMSGNVWEWCHDDYDANDVAFAPLNGFTKDLPIPKSTKVLRGGSWPFTGRDPRVRLRNWLPANFCDDGTGFRCVAV